MEKERELRNPLGTTWCRLHKAISYNKGSMSPYHVTLMSITDICHISAHHTHWSPRFCFPGNFSYESLDLLPKTNNQQPTKKRKKKEKKTVLYRVELEPIQSIFIEIRLELFFFKPCGHHTQSKLRHKYSKLVIPADNLPRTTQKNRTIWTQKLSSKREWQARTHARTQTACNQSKRNCVRKCGRYRLPCQSMKIGMHTNSSQGWPNSREDQRTNKLVTNPKLITFLYFKHHPARDALLEHSTQFSPICEFVNSCVPRMPSDCSKACSILSATWRLSVPTHKCNEWPEFLKP